MDQSIVCTSTLKKTNMNNEKELIKLKKKVKSLKRINLFLTIYILITLIIYLYNTY